MVLTVTSRVSGQRSMGPTGVRLQLKARVSLAISPVPKIKFCRKVGGGVRSSFFSRNFTFTNNSCCGTRAFGFSDRIASILCIRVNRSQAFDVFGMWDGLKVEKGCLGMVSLSVASLTICFGGLGVKGSGSGILSGCELACFILVC
jgi:hypothetical protein